MIKLITFTLLALTALVQSGAAGNVQGVGVFGKPQEVRKLIQEFRSGNQAGPQEPFLIEIEKILSDDALLQDVCSETTYQAIKNFHSRFVSGENLEPISEPIRNYFISFASDVALLCTRKLIERFDKELKNFSFQLRELDEFKNVKSLVGEYLKTSKQAEPKHVSELVIRDQHSPTIHLVIGEASNSEILRVHRGCLVRYDVAADRLFAPVAKLNKLGYGVGLLSMQETMALLSHKYSPWLAAIDVCETLKDLDIILDPRKKDLSLVSTEAASTLKAELATLPEVHRVAFDSVLPLDLEYEPVEFRQLTDQRSLGNVVAKFENELKRLNGGGSDGKMSLNDAFSVYGATAEFTTEKPESPLGKVMSRFGF